MQKKLTTGLNAVDVFKDLPATVLAELSASMEQQQYARGEILMRQGDVADAMFIVLSGRFKVTVEGQSQTVANLSAGAPIGEIAFITGGTRTATVTAMRDSIVLKLERRHFNRLCESNPAVWQTLAKTLAGRLAQTNVVRPSPLDPKPRTIAILRAGSSPLPQEFIDQISAVFKQAGQTTCIGSNDLPRETRIGSSTQTTRRLNALESDNEFIFYITDQDLTPWSKKAIRQADLILTVAWHNPGDGQSRSLNNVEAYADQIHEKLAKRLVVLHAHRSPVSDTASWLAPRSLAMHHHVALDDLASFERLYRFISGTARGLVVCGGGAFCSAHVGVYKALQEAGLAFDIMGGTSGGAAMAAAFAAQVTPEEIDRQTHEMFVVKKALKRLTLPIYSLLDHTHFDRQLRSCFGGIEIEDLWTPFFAVCTNLSSYELHALRHGKLWQAVRATGAIPALLPPFYTDDGEMLVDGALMDNVPVRVMHDLKSGPNVVLNFTVPKMERFSIDYTDLPSRGSLLAQLLNPWRRQALPDAPSLGTVLVRAMMANRHEFEQHLTSDDLLLEPPLPTDMTILDWIRHNELMQDAYHWGVAEIANLHAAHHKVLQMFGNSKRP